MQEVSIDLIKKIINQKFMEEKWNCAESTVYSILKYFEIEELDTPVTCASGLGAGIGGSKNVCGSVTGAAMAIGYIFGRYGFKAQNKQLATAVANSFIKSFEETYYTVKCEKLVRGFDFESKPRRLHCKDLVEFATIEAIKMIEKAEVK